MPKKLLANKLSSCLALSLLLSGSLTQFVFADDTSALERQIMSGEASPSAANVTTSGASSKPADSASHKAQESSESTSTTSVALPAPDSAPTAMVKPVITPPAPVGSGLPAAITSPNEEATHAAAPAAPTHSLQEKARVEESHSSSSRPELREEKATAAQSASVQPPAHKSTMLFGRIEQLAGSGAKFPSLQAMTPKLDTRQAITIKGQTQINNGGLSGTIVQSFPTNYQGNWGGHIVLQQVQVDPNYYRVDPEEAARTVQAMRPGMTGDVNFDFDRRGGKIALEPTHCLFMVPAGQTQVTDEVKKMYASNPAMGGMMTQVMGNMPVPISLEFGEVHQGQGETTVSGNKARQVVIKNEVRQLSPGVVEEQIVTETTTWDKHTNRPRTGYGETVVRFSTQNPTTMYVQAATVEYGADKKFLTKMVLYGSIGKGVVMNTDPMSAMMGGMGGMGGLGALGGMFSGGASNGATQMRMPTQIPGMQGGAAGNPMDMLKNLFGGQ